MVNSRIGAIDALHSAKASLRGTAEALAARAALEGDHLAGMLSESLDMQAGKLADVERWLEAANAGEQWDVTG